MKHMAFKNKHKTEVLCIAILLGITAQYFLIFLYTCFTSNKDEMCILALLFEAMLCGTFFYIKKESVSMKVYVNENGGQKMMLIEIIRDLYKQHCTAQGHLYACFTLGALGLCACFAYAFTTGSTLEDVANDVGAIFLISILFIFSLGMFCFLGQSIISTLKDDIPESVLVVLYWVVSIILFIVVYVFTAENLILNSPVNLRHIPTFEIIISFLVTELIITLLWFIVLCISLLATQFVSHKGGSNE